MNLTNNITRTVSNRKLKTIPKEKSNHKMKEERVDVDVEEDTYYNQFLEKETSRSKKSKYSRKEGISTKNRINQIMEEIKSKYEREKQEIEHKITRNPVKSAKKILNEQILLRKTDSIKGAYNSRRSKTKSSRSKYLSLVCYICI